jgi:hypothetical protein
MHIIQENQSVTCFSMISCPLPHSRCLRLSAGHLTVVPQLTTTFTFSKATFSHFAGWVRYDVVPRGARPDSRPRLDPSPSLPAHRARPFHPVLPSPRGCTPGEDRLQKDLRPRRHLRGPHRDGRRGVYCKGDPRRVSEQPAQEGGQLCTRQVQHLSGMDLFEMQRHT